MIKAVLFDVDGVLIDLTVEKAQEQFEKDWGITSAMTHEFFSTHFSKCLRGEEDLKKVIGPYLIQWKWSDSVNAFLDYWFESQKNVNRELLLEINKLKEEGLKVYIATNQEKYRAEYLTHKLGFGSIFEAVFSSHQLGFTKKNPEFFRIVLEKINVKPEEVLFWDDHMSYIQVAQSLGIHSEFYTNIEQFKAKMAAYVSI